MKFKASLDKLSIGISIGVGVLFVLIILLQVGASLQGNFIAAMVTGIFFSAIFLLSYLYHAREYTVSSSQLIINRPISNVVIERTAIQSVRIVSSSEMGAVIRTFGVGGLFGYFGKFASSSIGKMTWYATRRDHYVLIRLTSGENIIVTPDETQEFCSCFNN